jgi:hypothetical protein
VWREGESNRKLKKKKNSPWVVVGATAIEGFK